LDGGGEFAGHGSVIELVGVRGCGLTRAV
jgi:hypothetical protein